MVWLHIEERGGTTAAVTVAKYIRALDLEKTQDVSSYLLITVRLSL